MSFNPEPVLAAAAPAWNDLAVPADPDTCTGIGVIAPFDFALDRELWRWLPNNAAIHSTRLPFAPVPVTLDMALVLGESAAVRRATQDLLTPEPAVIAYACTSASFVTGAAGERALCADMTAAGAPIAVTTSGALIDALRALDVRRVAVVTPYRDEVTARLLDFLTEYGVATTSSVGLGMVGRIWRMTYADVLAAVRAVDTTQAEALFISCTNVPTYDLIAPLEALLGIPVLTANQVTMWAALRAAGLDAVGPGQRLLPGPNLAAA